MACSKSAMNGLKGEKERRTYHRVSSMKKVRFSALARPYDIHRRINVLPKPASLVSMTYVRVLSHTFCPSVGSLSAIATSSTNPLGLSPVTVECGSSACASASPISI